MNENTLAALNTLTTRQTRARQSFRLGTILGLLLAALFLATACSTIKVDPVSPNFEAFATGYAPIAIEDNEDGSLAADLGQRLESSKAGLPVVDSARFKLTAELSEDNTKRTVDYDTEKQTVRKRDSEGRVVRSYQKIVRYETTSVTTRYIVMDYRLEDVSSGEVLWSAKARRSAHEDRTRSYSYHYPSPPRHPDPPPLMKLVDRANESASRQLSKAVQKAVKQQNKLAAKSALAHHTATQGSAP